MGRRPHPVILALLFAAMELLVALPHVHPSSLRPELTSREPSPSVAPSCLLCALNPQASGELVTLCPLGTPEPSGTASPPPRLVLLPAALPTTEARSPPVTRFFAAC